MDRKVYTNGTSCVFKAICRCDVCHRIVLFEKVWRKEEVLFSGSYIQPITYIYCDECVNENKSVRDFLFREDGDF